LRQVRYLSPEWIEAAADAIAADDDLPATLAGVTLTVEQVVEDAPDAGPDGTVTWHITVADGKVALVAGPATEPDLRFTTSYETAAAVASGELPAQRAFVEGRLRVGGDLSLLITHMRAVAAVDDALAPVRARTTYDRPSEGTPDPPHDPASGR
jgi:SCP-2 sterol transfer family